MSDLATDAQGFMLSPKSALTGELLPHDRQADLLSRDLSLGFGAVGTVLASSNENGITILGLHAAFGAEDELIEALEDRQYVGREQTPRGVCRWGQSTLNGRSVDYFVATLKPADGEEIYMVSLFDAPLDAAGMARAEETYRQRRPLTLSYLQLAKFNRARRERECALEMALSTMRTGVVLLDEHANVVFSNVAADRMFKAADCLKLHRGRLLTTNLRDNVRLTVALQHAATLGDSAAADQRAPLLSLERGDHTSLILLALALHPGEVAHGDAVTILHIVDPKVDFADHVRPLCKLYQLSRTETDLACLLAKGLTLAHAAETMRLKEQTARSCLRSIFYKTGTGRQTELMLLLLSRVVPTSSTLQIEPF